MESKPQDGSMDYVDSLVQPSITHLELTRKDSFSAWHKPRKHWVRRNQWQAEALDLIISLGLAGGTRPLSYLSLPGPDLLDVRTMQQVCVTSGVGLRFVGFMGSQKTADQTELNISLDEVMRLEGIHPDPVPVSRTPG